MKKVVYDVGNEQVVIRAAIADAAARRKLVHQISPDEFLHDAHAALWRALRRCSDGGLDPTADVLRAMWVGEGKPDDEYLAELMSAGEAQNVDWHVQTLRWDAARHRVLTGAAAEMVKLLEDPKATPESVVSAARATLRALDGGHARKHVHRRESLSKAYRDELQLRREDRGFWSYGFGPDFDGKLTEGSAPGKLSLFSGLSGCGKSTVCARLALNLAVEGRRVAVAAWEMGGISTLDLMVCSMTGIGLRSLIRGTTTPADSDRAARAADWITRRIVFMENAFFSDLGSGKRDRWSANERNMDVLEGYLAEVSADVWVFDLWERMLRDHSPEAVTNALTRQQQLCVEYNFHGILVQQLNLKEVERRGDKRPTREAIKGTGAYVEVADLIFGVHRDAQFKAVPDDSAELICLKQRKGPANWAYRFTWDGERCTVKDPVEVEFDPGLESDDVGDVARRVRNNRGHQWRRKS